MRIRNLKVGLVLTIIGAITASAIALASGGTITPAGDSFITAGTNIEFEGGPAASPKCTLAMASGVIPTPAASTMEVQAPIFENINGTSCGIATSGKWQLTDSNGEFGWFTLPQAKQFVLTKGTCKVWNKANAKITLLWKAGTGGLPSTFHFETGSFEVQSGEECSEKISALGVHGTMVVNDTTHLTEPVKF